MSGTLLPIIEAGRRLGMTRSTSYRAAAKGQLLDGVPVLRRGSKLVVREDDVELALRPAAAANLEPDPPPAFAVPAGDVAADVVETLRQVRQQLVHLQALSNLLIAQVDVALTAAPGGIPSSG